MISNQNNKVVNYSLNFLQAKLGNSQQSVYDLVKAGSKEI